MNIKSNLHFSYKQGVTTIALRLPGYYVWDNSVIKANNKYYMFSSRWEKELGFGWNWMFHSRTILSVSDKPEGPFSFIKEVFPRRGREYFDGMNTHNTCIKEYAGKYYLYYMGTTYDYEPPKHMDDITMEMIDSTWKKKRIGLAISDTIDGEYVRQDAPILLPREYPAWDSTITTNPTVVIKNNGETLMVYKSSRCLGHILKDDNALKLGAATANKPEGPYKRLFDEPILQVKENNISIEDPFIWYDENREIYCLLFKDCVGNITGDFGDLIYAESKDLKEFEMLADHPAFTRNCLWKDGHSNKQPNLERPFILFENGEPSYLYCSSGDGNHPYQFEGETYIVAIKLEKVK